MSLSAIPLSKASVPDRTAGVADVHRDYAVSAQDPGPGGLPGPAASGSTAIAVAALRSLVLIVIATLMVLVALPAALVAAGT